MDISLLKGLSSLVSPDSFLLGEQACLPYQTDWTKTPGKPGAVVLPRSTQEVARILAYCSSHNIPVVPSGGRTGLAAGAVATQGEVVVNLSKLNQMGAVNTLCRSLSVGAGAITQAVHQHAEKSGLTWPIDLASKGSCQIGGNLSTNAGGVRVVRYGMARKWVTGITVVTMAGEVLELNAELEKNNTGYDLLQLVVGSEGTLGIITEANLKLIAQPSEAGKTVYFFSVAELQSLPALFEKFRSGPFDLQAFEFFSSRCLEAVGKKLGRFSRLTQPGKYYALAEVTGSDSRDGWLEEVVAQEGVLDSMQATAYEDRKETWALRESITESISLTGAVRKHDLCVPLQSVAPFLAEVEQSLQKKRYAIVPYFFGHFGDGSPHVNLVQAEGVSREAFNGDCDVFEEQLFSILKKYRGSISSEHGIGLLKKKWLPFSRTRQEIDVFRGIKSILDPKWLLNPGKIFDVNG